MWKNSSTWIVDTAGLREVVTRGSLRLRYRGLHCRLDAPGELLQCALAHHGVVDAYGLAQLMQRRNRDVERNSASRIRIEWQRVVRKHSFEEARAPVIEDSGKVERGVADHSVLVVDHTGERAVGIEQDVVPA